MGSSERQHASRLSCACLQVKIGEPVAHHDEKIEKMPPSVPALVHCRAQQPVHFRGCVHKYPPLHLLLAVIASKDLKDLRMLQEHIDKEQRFLAGNAFTDSALPANLSVPGKSSLLRARISLDIASMAMNREDNHSADVYWRQLNFDASPQKGTEILGIREFCVKNRCVKSGSSHRSLPLQCLGHGHSAALGQTDGSSPCDMVCCGTQTGGHGDVLQAGDSNSYRPGS